MLPENLVRHTRDWGDVGLHKADPVAAAIQRIDGSVEVQARRTRLDAQESSAGAAGLDQRLAECDLIIDATASAASFNRAAQVAVRSKTPLLWLLVYAGGIGGLLARSRPERDPEPLMMRAQLENWASTQDAVAPETVQDYGSEQADGTVQVASDAHVSAVAAHLAAMALDTLTEIEPSAYSANAYLVGMRRDWVFDGPLHVIPLALEGLAETAKKPSPEGKARMQSFIRDLLQEARDDDHSTE